jgi:hypothetical protein
VSVADQKKSTKKPSAEAEVKTNRESEEVAPVAEETPKPAEAE